MSSWEQSWRQRAGISGGCRVVVVVVVVLLTVTAGEMACGEMVSAVARSGAAPRREGACGEERLHAG